MRRDAAAALLRAVLVAGLLVLAALGTAARRDLSWRALFQPPRDRLATAVLVVVGAAALAGVAWLAVEAWRRRQRRQRVPKEPERAAEEIPLDRRAVVLAVTGAVLLAVALAVLGGALLRRQRGTGGQVRDGTPGDGSGPSAGFSPWWIALLLGVLVLLVTALLARWWTGRARGPQPGRSVALEPAGATIAEAAAAARRSMAGHDEVRAGILAAYEAMVAVLAARGARRRPADTAGDLLERALRSSAVPARAGQELTALFWEARFSSHPMSDADRARAEAALGEIAGTDRPVRAGG